MNRFKVLLVAFVLFSRFVYGQSEDKKTQLDLLLGLSSITDNPGSTVGIGIDRTMNKFVFSGQFLVNQRSVLLTSESQNYYNLDILAGWFKNKNKVGVSLSTGVGLAFRNDGKQAMYSNYSSEKSYVTPGLPIRGKFIYKLGEHISLGLIGYANLNFKQNISSLSFDVGYRF